MNPDTINRLAMWATIVLITAVVVAVGGSAMSDEPASPDEAAGSAALVEAPRTSSTIPIVPRDPALPDTSTTEPPTTTTGAAGSVLGATAPLEPTTTIGAPPTTQAPPTATVEPETTTTQAPPTAAVEPETTTTHAPPTAAVEPETTTTEAPAPAVEPETTTTEPPPTTTTEPSTTTTEPPPEPDDGLFVEGFSGETSGDPDDWTVRIRVDIGAVGDGSARALVTIAWSGSASGSDVIAVGRSGEGAATYRGFAGGSVTFTITGVRGFSPYRPELDRVATSIGLSAPEDVDGTESVGDDDGDDD